MMKRKLIEGRYGRRDRWWFLLHGPESILDELSSAWSNVSLQVGWKLEECTKPSEDENMREQNEESHAATNATERTSQFELTTTATAAAEDGTNVESNAPTNNQNDESNVAPFLGENNKINL